jgi:hypothetical protein
MKIKIKHKKPLILPHEGKWRIQDTDIHFYVFKDEWLLCETQNEVRTLLLDTIVFNPNVKGRISEDGNTLIYEQEIDEMNIVLNDKFVFLSLKEKEI